MSYLRSFVIVLTIAAVYEGMLADMPIDKVTMNKVDIKMTPNPYFDDWTGSISPSKDRLSLKMPIKKNLPLTMMMKILITYAGIELPETDMLLCAAFEDPTLGKDILSHGVPKGKFPKNCPVKAGEDFTIDNYKFPPKNVPPGTPPGPASGTVTIYEEGKDPFVIITVNGQLDLPIPSIPTVPGFG